MADTLPPTLPNDEDRKILRELRKSVDEFRDVLLYGDTVTLEEVLAIAITTIPGGGLLIDLDLGVDPGEHH